jgi:chemotaxis family two-component system response regulator Rcp1
MKILVVEDSSGDQRLLKEAFRQCAVELTFAFDAIDAMKILKAQKNNPLDQRCRMILVDLNLPKKNGKELLKDLKNDKDLRRLPVIMLTSSEAEKDIADCYESGASGYLIKPMTFDELESLVAAFCDFWLKKVRLPQ